MKKKELKQIYYLTREIDMWQKELDDIEYDIKLLSKDMDDTKEPADSIADKIEELKEKIAEIKVIITDKLIEKLAQRKKILDFIEEIDDSMIRQIVHYRYVACMDWRSVAHRIGGNNTIDSIRKIQERYLDKKLQ